MNKYFALLAIAVGASLPMVPATSTKVAPVPVPAPTQVEIAARLTAASVTVIHPSGSTGSGFVFLHDNRVFIWTAAHVVRAESQLIVSRGHGSASVAIVKTLKCDATADIALLECTTYPFGFFTAGVSFAPGNESVPVGTEVFHVGSFYGNFTQSFSTGVISGLDRTTPEVTRHFDQVSCPAFPGSSGGGIFLKDGRCIGLLARQASPVINFFIPVCSLRQWATANNVLYAINHE